MEKLEPFATQVSTEPAGMHGGGGSLPSSVSKINSGKIRDIHESVHSLIRNIKGHQGKGCFLKIKILISESHSIADPGALSSAAPLNPDRACGRSPGCTPAGRAPAVPPQPPQLQIFGTLAPRGLPFSGGGESMLREGSMPPGTQLLSCQDLPCLKPSQPLKPPQNQTSQSPLTPQRGGLAAGPLRSPLPVGPREGQTLWVPGPSPGSEIQEERISPKTPSHRRSPKSHHWSFVPENLKGCFSF